MNRLLRPTLNRWTLQIGCIAGLALALGSRAQSATALSVELLKEATGGAGAPAVVQIQNLPIPAGGAVVTVSATLCNSRVPAPLTTLFVLGGGNVETVDRNMRAAIDASPDLITALQADPNATITVTVCPKGGHACTTSAPFPAEFHH